MYGEVTSRNHQAKPYNRPRSIYQYSNMAPRLSGQTSIFGVVFFAFESLLGIERQKKLKKFIILTRKPRSHVRILIYRTWPIVELLPGLLLFWPSAGPLLFKSPSWFLMWSVVSVEERFLFLRDEWKYEINSVICEFFCFVIPMNLGERLGIFTFFLFSD